MNKDAVSFRKFRVQNFVQNCVYINIVLTNILVRYLKMKTKRNL